MITTPKQIMDEIEYSKRLLDLKENWDEEDALPIDVNAYNKAIEFLINYGSILKEEGYIIATPQIDPCPDGSVDIYWKVKSITLLINFKNINKNVVASIYGNQKNDNGLIFKTLKIDKININLYKTDILRWMENLSEFMPHI